MNALRKSDQVVVAKPTQPTSNPEPVKLVEEDIPELSLPRPAEPFLGRAVFPQGHEELELIFDQWEFKIRSPFVHDNDYTFSFAVDDKLVIITPKYEAACEVRYKQKAFRVVFAGGNLKFPGIPFSILSFLKDNRECPK